MGEYLFQCRLNLTTDLGSFCCHFLLPIFLISATNCESTVHGCDPALHISEPEHIAKQIVSIGRLFAKDNGAMD